MKVEEFRVWLDERFASNTVSTAISTCKRVENAYGDLDDIYDTDGIDTLLSELTYSKLDEVNGKPDPSKLGLEKSVYDTLSSSRTHIRTYRKFRDDPEARVLATESAIEVAGELLKEKREGRQFEVERHLQDELRKEIAQLEPGLVVIDSGAERNVESGFIDITAEDANGRIVVIELKKGLAKRESIGQLLGYMGDIKSEEPDADVRGILVAADFDQSCLSTRAVVPSLSLKRYSFSFRFEDA